MEGSRPLCCTVCALVCALLVVSRAFASALTRLMLCMCRVRLRWRRALRATSQRHLGARRYVAAVRRARARTSVLHPADKRLATRRVGLSAAQLVRLALV